MLGLYFFSRLARAPTTSTPSTLPKSGRDSPPKSTIERSQSEYPTPVEAMQHLSLQSSATATVRSQTHPRPLNRRRILHSVIPDTTILTPAHRPAESGQSGQRIEIYTNHFKVSMDDAIINQYQIEIVMIRRDGTKCPARKNERWETIQELTKRIKNFPLVW